MTLYLFLLQGFYATDARTGISFNWKISVKPGCYGCGGDENNNLRTPVVTKGVVKTLMRT